jgi:type I restriction enzyme S subunit
MDTRKLINITTKIGSGATPKGGKNSYGTSGISLIRSLNVYDYQFDHDQLAFINQNQADELSNVVVQEADILLNITGASVARCCIVPKKILPARVNQHVAIIRVDKNHAIPKFVFYSLVNPLIKNTLFNLAQGGATREALTKSTIENFEIRMPSISVQQKITFILSAYDDLIENNTRRIQILEQMAQTIYKEWFVNFRFPGYENSKFVDSPLGKIPEGWEVKKLGKVITFIKGKKPRNVYENLINGLVKLLLLDNIATWNYKYTDYEGRVCIKEGDIVMVMDGASSGKVFIGLNGFLGSTLATIKMINNKEIIYQMYYFLVDNIKNISANNTGAAIPHANKDYINQLDIVIPANVITKSFYEFINPINSQIVNLKSKINNLRHTRDLLLPKLMSGEVEV